MELSYQLQTIEPLTGAFDIIRYFGKLEEMTADAGKIQDSLGLSDRSFDKAIRRLVTKGYVQMDGSRIYRLTEQGQRAVEELAAYDQAGPSADRHTAATEPGVSRRLVMAVPRTLVAGRADNVLVGVHAASEGETIDKPADLLFRVSIVNGEPSTSQDKSVELSNAAVAESFTVTPGRYATVRVRLQVFQLDPYSGDITPAGGMYIDADVTGGGVPGELVAYGTEVTITPVD